MNTMYKFVDPEGIYFVSFATVVWDDILPSLNKKIQIFSTKIIPQILINFERLQLDQKKLMNIISLSEQVLGIENLDIEIEYQSETIGKYDLGFDGEHFILLAKRTNCLAKALRVR